MTRRRGMARLCACAAAALAGLLASELRAQEEPLIIGGGQDRPSRFHIERPQVVLSLLAAYSKSTSSSANGDEVRTTQTIFQEILGASTQGFVLSPNFIDMSLSASFGFQQADIDTNSPTLVGQSGVGDEETYEYDFTANILRLSGAPLMVFARRSQEIITQPFGASYESIADTFGASWQIKHRTLPTTLRYQRLSLEQTTLGGDLDFSSTEDVLSWDTSWRPTSNQMMTWRYRFSNASSEGAFGEEDEQTHDAALAHTLTFGRNARSTLESVLEYYSRSSDQSYDRMRWNERLRLRHSETFETRYMYDYSQYSFSGLTNTETTYHHGSAGFTHWFYQSLVTTGNVSYRLSETDIGAQTTEWLADLTLDYRKKVPLGILFLTGTGVFSQQTSESRSVPVQVVDQPLTFVGFQPALIAQQSIVPGSIRLTQRRGAGEEVFLPGIDYIVTPVPAGVEIRPVGVNITPGEPVLVDYVIAPQGESETTTSSFSLGARYAIERGWLRGLTPYARYFVQQQDVSASGPNPPLANDITSYTFGADYRIWYLLFRAEHQIVDSTLMPLEATRFRVEWAQDLRADLRAGANLEHTIIRYTDTGAQTDATSITAMADYRLSRTLTATGRMSWIHQTDSISGVTEGWDSELALRWRYRQTQIFGSVRHTNLSTEDFESDNMLFQIGLERKF